MKRFCFCIFFCMSLFLYACSANQENTATDIHENNSIANIDEEENEELLRFSWAYDVFTPGVEMGVYQEEGQLVRSTEYYGKELVLGIKMRFILDEPKAIDCVMMVLVDGLPVSFIADGSKESAYKHMFSVEDENVQTITITPEFAAPTGRVDIIVATDITNPLGDSAVIPVFVENKTENYTDEQKNPVSTTMLPTAFSTLPQKDTSLIDWWLWSNDVEQDELSSQSVKDNIYLKAEGNEWLYSSTTGLPGDLRTVFFLDYLPFEVSNGKSYVDWEPEYGEMLSLPIEFPEVNHPSMLITVTTRMDDVNMTSENIILRRILISPEEG